MHSEVHGVHRLEDEQGSKGWGTPLDDKSEGRISTTKFQSTPLIDRWSVPPSDSRGFRSILVPPTEPWLVLPNVFRGFGSTSATHLIGHSEHIHPTCHHPKPPNTQIRVWAPVEATKRPDPKPQDVRLSFVMPPSDTLWCLNHTPANG